MAGESAAAAVLQQNLAEEEAMASWLEEHLPAVTSTYIELRASGDRAKN
jgi:ferritin-like metal-binding protein YciE